MSAGGSWFEQDAVIAWLKERGLYGKSVFYRKRVDFQAILGLLEKLTNYRVSEYYRGLAEDRGYPPIGSEVMVYDRYRFAIPVKGKVIRFSAETDGIEVELLTTNNASYPVGKNIWIDRRQSSCGGDSQR